MNVLQIIYYLKLINVNKSLKINEDNYLAIEACSSSVIVK